MQPAFTSAIDADFEGVRYLTPFDPNDSRYQVPFKWTIGPNKESKNWRPDDETDTVALMFRRLARHQGNKSKDGLAFVLGEMVPGQRLKKAVKALYAIGLDFDKGTPPERIDAAMKALGYACIRYTTHSNGKTQDEFNLDEVLKFAPDAEDIDTELMRRFLREKEGWDEGIVATVEFEGEIHDKRGRMVRVAFAPMPKNRVVIPLKEPVVIKDLARTQKEAMEKWTKVPVATAELMALRDALDMTGTDPSRLFYYPRHAENMPWEITICGGDLFDWRSLELDNPWDAAAQEVEGKSKGGKSKTGGGQDLASWSREHAEGFQIASLIQDYCEDRIRGNGSTGVEIECPFDDGHSNPGDPDDRACQATNAGDGPAPVFSIKCQHESCRTYTNLDMLAKMVADGWFMREVIDSDDYNPDIAQKIDREDKAKEKYQQAIEGLTEQSADDDIEAAICCCIDANLGIRSFDAALKLLSERTNTPISVIRKLVKVCQADMRAASEGKKEDHGLDIFSYSGEFSFPDAVKKCVRVLKTANEKAKLPLFAQSEGTPVRYDEKNGRVTFEPLTWTDLWSELNERITFVRKSDQAESAHKEVPREVATQFHAQARKYLPTSPEVIYTPIYLAGGDLMVSPGYWPEHDLLMVDTGLEVPKVSMKPTREEAEASRDWILENLLGDFPFLDVDKDGNERRAPSEANALAYVITPFMRREVRGNTPLFLIAKPTPGTGASFLAELGMKLCGGMRVMTAPINYTGNPEEMEKKIVSAIREGRSHMFFDNVREFNNPVLLASLTSEVVGGRDLGKAVNLHKPNTFTWVVTGIAPKVGGEMHRRTCWIRLNNKLPRGAKREYRHANFNAFLEKNRALAIHHILTMIEYWHESGAKEFEARELPSFEDWSRKVGGVLDACGVEGFLDSPAPVILDPESASDDSFLRDMHEKYKDRYASVTDLFDWAGPKGAELAIAMTGHPEERQRNFAEALGRLNGVTFVSKDKESYQLRARNDDTDGVVFGIVPVKTKVPA